MIVMPILSRIFTPEAFGFAALFASIVGTISVVVCLRYEHSIMLAQTDEEAVNLLVACLCFAFIIAGISALIIFLGDDLIARLLNSPELRKYLWLVPVAVLISGMSLPLRYWNSRIKHFGHLSIAQLMSSVTTQATRLGAGFAGFVTGGVLIATTILGQIVSTIILSARLWRGDRHLFRGNISRVKMIAGIKLYKKFPIFSTWSILLNTASHQLPTLLLAFYFSPKIVGFYALGKRALSMPMSLVGTAITQVFFQRASEEHNRTGDLSQVVEQVSRRLVCLGIFPILLLTLIGEDLFVVAFGARWVEAGVYMQILGIWLFFSFIFSPIGTLFSILEKQGTNLIFNAVLFITRLLSLIAGGMAGSPRVALILFSATGVTSLIGMYYWLFRKAGISFAQPIRYIGKYCLYCLPIVGLTVISKWGFGLNPYKVVIMGCLSAIPYYAIVFRQDKYLQKTAQMAFKSLGFLK